MMSSFIYVFRLLYSRRYWLIIGPTAVAILIYLMTADLPQSYDVKTTIYTGVVSGFNIESGGSERHDWNTVNNAMDNLANIISSQSTLKHVSMRLYAQHMMYGDPDKDNNYITAAHYRSILRKTPKEVLALIDKTSERKTLDNLYAYEKSSPKNFVYGLFNWSHRHYSYEALSKITIRRLANSDMLEVRYSADDPGIAYHTLVILNEEFIKQYEDLRFGETNNVIAYFEAELARIGKLLRIAEDSLTNYNVKMRVINYDEQTKYIAALGRDFEIRYEDILLAHDGSEKMVNQLEARIEEHVKQLRNNGIFINKLNVISDLTAKIVTLESFGSDSLVREAPSLPVLRKQLAVAEKDFTNFAEEMSTHSFTKEGLSTSTVVEQWLAELIRYEKAKAELNVMRMRRFELDKQYAYFSPIGSTIKRKEREINFTEQSYLSVLNSLNAARLRQKNLQMTSATLKIINPPTYPIAAMPTKRKLMVAAGFIGTFIFLMGMFILIELLDRTLRDKTRTERLTSGTVLGAFPADKIRGRAYNKMCTDLATQFMSNAILNLFKPDKTNIINVLSTEKQDGKSYLSEQLAEYWGGMGMKVRILSWETDFDSDTKEFHMARNVEELYQPDNEDVVIIEYKNLLESSIPGDLLRGASVNILTTRANRVWDDTDQLLFDKLKEIVGETPLFFCLTKAQREVVQNFTGLLPPYTYLRKLGYRLYHFGLTAVGS